jgi:hypothetical protein
VLPQADDLGSVRACRDCATLSRCHRFLIRDSEQTASVKPKRYVKTWVHKYGTCKVAGNFRRGITVDGFPQVGNGNI